MHVVTNEALLRRRFRLGMIFQLAALAVYGVGLFIVFADPATVTPFGGPPQLYAWPLVVVSLVCLLIAQNFLRRYGPRYRQDEALQKALKGLDGRFTLFNFLSPSLPDYILVGPAGVHVLIPRPHGGQIVCQQDRWSRPGSRLAFLGAFFGNPLGNPSLEAGQGIATVTRQLRQRAPDALAEDTPIQALIVFMGSNVRLHLEGCSYPATTGRELRNLVRRQRGRLGPKQVDRLREALAGMAA